MGGQTAFGYEQEDGTVLYVCIFPAKMFDEIIGYFSDRTMPIKSDLTDVAESVEDYFSQQRDNDEDTVWRVLYRSDGTTLCRVWSMPGDIVYIPRNLVRQ